jgi:hypothetical protein
LQRELVISTILNRSGIELLGVIAKRAATIAGVPGGWGSLLTMVESRLPEGW